MFDTFLLTENIPFTIAIIVAMCIGILELINLLVGGITDAFDTLIPEKDFSIDIGDGFSFTDYLCIGRIPFLMWLVIMLTSFGIIGIFFQSIFHTSLFIAAPISFVLAVFPTRHASLFLQKILPQDETTAITSDTLVGRTATIVIGTASVNNPAQAKVKDEYNHTHYVMVVPEDINDKYAAGTDVILYSYNGVLFTAITKIT